MRSVIALGGLLAITATAGWSQQFDHARLRQVARLPSLTTEFNVGFSSRRGFEVGPSNRNIPIEISGLQKSLRQDVTDAPRYLRLGSLYRELRDEAHAEEAITKALQLSRAQVRTYPRDGRLLVQLADALAALHKDAEAEATFRRAAATAPKDWRTWVALGRFLESQATVLVLGKESNSGLSFGQVLSRVAEIPPTATQITRAQKLLDEARHSYARGVAADAAAPNPYAQRGLYRVWGGFLESLLTLLRQNRDGIQTALAGGPGKIIAASLSPEALNDFRKAAKLDSRNYRALTTVILFEIMQAATQRNRAGDMAEGGLWNTLPSVTRASIQNRLDQLERLARSTDRRTASGASEAAGVLQLALQSDLARAEGNLRHAVALDPSRGGAWELLASLAFERKRFSEVVSICQDWGKRADSVRCRLVQAKAHEKLEQFAQAEAAIQAALKLQPDDFTANLGLAVLLLKRGDDPAMLARAGERLRRTADLIGKSLPPSQLADYGVTLGIYQALFGDPASGVQQFKRVLQYDPDHEGARAALDVLWVGAPLTPGSAS